jgi:hypothetical protein
MSSQSASESDSFGSFGQAADPDFLGERLRRLSTRDQSPTGTLLVAGQRIFEYENALTPLVPRQALGFKVIKRTGNETARVNLEDFPNGMHPFVAL